MSGLHLRILAKLRHYIREIWYFLSSAIFLRNFGKMLGLSFLLLVFTMWWMRCYTRHGQSSKVGSYVGLQIKEATKKIKNDGFRYVLSDSVFMVDKAPGLVLSQKPEPNSSVKKRRKIYLTVTKQTPDLVNLPGIVGNYDYTQYVKKLSLLGIKFKVREQVFDNREEENTIKYFYFGDQKITDELLREGVKVPMGSTLEFVVSTRTGGSIAVPDLVCLKYSEAEFIVTASNLSFGIVHEDADVADRDEAYVYKQIPDNAGGAVIPFGNTIEIFLSAKIPAGCGD